MLLTSIKLNGFKTFPDKATLSFGQGVTAVVGPNGSGKSNISDAIRWVLGEQSVKTLRCSKMEDIIFSGTTTTKAHGFAEVTLTIENNDRKLPFDADEVAITRRYYRSGESEYLINKSTVRLKDIHQLFMDTGLGRDGYSMISQGKIDSIIASKSEDRREIFEEAAGISRYRYRKLEAERKLKQAQENLLRLNDILSELEGRVGPLKEQAEKANEYLLYSNEKKKLEIGLWLGTIEKSSVLLREQESKIVVSKKHHQDVELALEKIKNDVEKVFFQVNECTSEIEEQRKQISLSEETAAHKSGEISVLENDISHNNENKQRINDELSRIAESDSTLDGSIKLKEDEILRCQEEIRLKNEQLGQTEAALDKFRKEIRDSSDEINALNQSLSELNLKSSDEKVKSLSSMSSIEEFEARLSKICENIQGDSQQIALLEGELSENTMIKHEATKRVERFSAEVFKCEERLALSKGNYEDLREKANELSLSAEETIRKVRLLEELERNLDGFSHSVKMIMREAKKGALKGIHGPVSRIISVPSKYSVAIETALGAAMQNIVVGSEDDAKKAIALLKQKNSGRATFLPISVIRGKKLTELDVKNYPSVVGVASELCSCEDQYREILAYLLGKIIIVENLDQAVELAKKINYRFRIITLDGQVVNAGGSLTGGSLAKNSGLINRASQIEELKSKAQVLKEQAHSAHLAFHEAENEIKKTESELASARRACADAREERISIEAECRVCDEKLSKAKAAVAQAQKEQDALQKRIAELKEIHASADNAYNALLKEIAEIEAKIAEIAGSRQEISEKREALTLKIQNLKLDTISLEKDISSLNAEINIIKTRKSDNTNQCAQLKRQIQELADKNKATYQKIDEIKIEIQNLRESAKNSETKIEEIRNKRVELEKSSVTLRQEERDQIEEREKISRDLAKLEEQKISLQREYDTIILKLWEEYELTKKEAEQICERLSDVAGAQKRLNQLKLKIKNLGTINVAAIEEYKEVSERYEFLNAQITDIEKSKDELTKLIYQLTNQMKELFLERFDQINKNFSAIFSELFGGGTASLAMTDTQNILTSGIDISVHPPGKIVTYLESLSGGEKALVAIALYFAIMKVRPAPFCVLDEIEAALDDVNVDRYAAYLRKMSSETQFIVITHRRGTMEEADVLYGVTMQDEGISRLLQLNVSELAQKLGIK